jgi:hypothetical protein
VASIGTMDVPLADHDEGGADMTSWSRPCLMGIPRTEHRS